MNTQTTMASIPTVPLTCEFEAEGFADSTIIYDPILRTATVTTGSPAVTQVFTEVTVATGLEPYGDGGFSVIAFGDVPLFHVNLKSEKTCGLMSYFKSAHGRELRATWGSAPGGPSNVLDAGRCTVEGSKRKKRHHRHHKSHGKGHGHYKGHDHDDED
ncbi:MAG: hypothetical protein HC883_01145 [Bdellovibrionaceae bacterium]|nr:hypothetical protein [Pseudobdellovibrionaceae bacterium]